MTLDVRSGAEALFVAIEMEKRAVRMYERMLMLVDDPHSTAVIAQLLKDEVTHLERFQDLMGGEAVAGLDAMLLSARANDILFSGGLTQAAREGAFQSPQSIVKYALDQEDIAVKTYAGFAERSRDAARRAFQEISDEEKTHFDALMAISQAEA